MGQHVLGRKGEELAHAVNADAGIARQQHHLGGGGWSRLVGRLAGRLADWVCEWVGGWVAWGPGWVGGWVIAADLQAAGKKARCHKGIVVQAPGCLRHMKARSQWLGTVPFPATSV